MKTTQSLALAFALCCCTTAVRARDTNPPAKAPAAAAAAPAAPDPAAEKIAEDVKRLVLDTFAALGGVSWGSLAFGAYYLLKAVRNRTSLGRNPTFAPLLNALNAEAKGDFSQPTAPLTNLPVDQQLKSEQPARVEPPVAAHG